MKADETNGDVVFFSDFPDYSRVDRGSLMQVLSSNVLAGAGPQGFYMKTWEAGLAYSNGVANNPNSALLQYYADRIPDIPALVEFVNSLAKQIDRLKDETLVDYSMSQTFAFSRTMLSPAQRGRLIAQDIRDGTEPADVRRAEAWGGRRGAGVSPVPVPDGGQLTAI